MEGHNNQGENSSQNVEQLLFPTEPHHSDSESNPRTPSPLRVVSPSPNRRPRGRPPGSKNKPKPPVVVTRDSPNALKGHLLEVPAGADIVERLTNYARENGRGVCILSGKGTLSSAAIGQVTASGGTVITFHGANLEIFSLHGTVIPPPAPQGIPLVQEGHPGLSVFLSAGQGRLVAGRVAGPLIAAGPVVLMASSFASIEFERLQGNAGGGSQVQASQSVTALVPPNNPSPRADGFAWGGSNGAPRPPF